MNLIQEITQVFSRYKGKAAISHYVPPNSSMTLTYGQLGERVGEFARFLQVQGMQPGDLIMCYMSKSLELVVSILAVMLNGGVCSSFYSKQNPQYPLKLLSIAYPRFLLLDESTLRNMKKSMRTTGSGNEYPVYMKYSELQGIEFRQDRCGKTIYVLNDPSGKNDNRKEEPATSGCLDNAVCCLFTSGSTGVPKGVLISREDLLRRAMTEIEDYELTDQDSLLSLLPFSFDVGLNQLLSSLLSGSHLVILNSWFPKDILTTIRSQRITGVSGVPSIWADVIAYPKEPDFDQFVRDLRYITVSGGDLAKNQLAQLRQYLKNTKIYKTYGQTETFRSNILKPPHFEKKMTSVGRPVEGTQVFILNDKGEIAPPNIEGEIVHYGVGTMLGYINDLEGTNGKLREIVESVRRTVKEGKLVFTGDRGKMDQEGYLYVLGREDGMIKTLGNRVYPKEIESCLLEHEHVKNAAVVGIRDERKGQMIIAEVIGNGALDRQRLMVFLKERLPYYMIPGEINIVERLPMTENGKIKYTTIKEKYEERRFLQSHS
jgi:acyl-coenzyme A synthetase/AMP-(fatty) acid ligase